MSAILTPTTLRCAASCCVCRPVLHWGPAPVVCNAGAGARPWHFRLALSACPAAACSFAQGTGCTAGCTTAEELRFFLHSTGMLTLLQAD